MNYKLRSSEVVEFIPKPKSLRLVNHLDRQLSEALSGMIESLYEETGLKYQVQRDSFYQSTSQKIASATYLHAGTYDLYVLYAKEEPVGYCLCEVSTMVSGDLTYGVCQAWIDPPHRNHKDFIGFAEEIRLRAKELMCRHIVYYALARNSRAFARILGKRVSPYFIALKEDL